MILIILFIMALLCITAACQPRYKWIAPEIDPADSWAPKGYNCPHVLIHRLQDHVFLHARQTEPLPNPYFNIETVSVKLVSSEGIQSNPPEG